MRTPMPRMNHRGRTTVIVLACVVLLFILLGWLVDAWTDYLWFSEVRYAEVFTTMLWTRLALFAIFAVGMGLIVWFNLWLAFQLRPMLRLRSAEQQSLERYRALISPRFGLWSGLLAAVIGLFGGLSAQGRWQQWLLFVNARPFGIRDPQFGIDLSFYVFAYPFWRYLLGVGFTLVVLCVLGTLATHYLFGGVRLQGAGDRMTWAARAHLTTLVAVFVLLKAVAYFLDQRGMLLSRNAGTNLYGAGYTDINALLPAKEILAWISVVVAVGILVFSNAFIRNLVWPGIAVGLLAISAIAIDGIYPAAVQTFHVKPNIRDREATYIQRSIDATRAAFGLDVEVSQYSSTTAQPPASLATDTDTVANTRLLDPSIVSNTFTQLQQVRGFYDFTQKLDIDRYTVSGQTQDYVVGVRELDYNNLTAQQSNWQNQHTVFTHGYGLVAAPANQIVCNGQPLFVSGLLSTSQQGQTSCQSPGDEIAVQRPQIYFGENMNPYAIVGKATPSDKDVEYDRPGANVASDGTADDQYVTYEGGGGVSVGSYLRRMLYAYKYKETNFLISPVFNKNSKILYVRDPRARVQKVAPFLTIDGDPYPAVVDGQIVWILDGYTTASTYPYSQQIDLRSATSDTLTGEGTAPQARQDINYLRNSVKATVNAYTGQVTLYAFGAPDPVLQTWNKAFGGKLIKPSSAIPPELAAHFRYPEDQFKVQRELLTRFHVTDPSVFYSGQDFWQVPEDPAPDKQANQAPYYLLAKFPGQSAPTFQLTAAMTPRSRQNLAALITGSYVDGKPQLEILQLPQDTQIQGPGQADQKMTNDNAVRPLITSEQLSATVIYGNLLSLPVGGGMLYVEPLYVQSKSGQGTYPQLKYVLVNFGQYVGVADNLAGALDNLMKSAAAGGTPSSGAPPTGTGPPAATNPRIDQALQQVDQALADLSAAQKSGDFAGYGHALAELNDAVAAYEQARKAAAASPAPSASPSAGTSPGPSGSAPPAPPG